MHSTADSIDRRWAGRQELLLPYENQDSFIYSLPPERALASMLRPIRKEPTWIRVPIRPRRSDRSQEVQWLGTPFHKLGRTRRRRFYCEGHRPPGTDPMGNPCWSPVVGKPRPGSDVHRRKFRPFLSCVSMARVSPVQNRWVSCQERIPAALPGGARTDCRSMRTVDKKRTIVRLIACKVTRVFIRLFVLPEFASRCMVHTAALFMQASRRLCEACQHQRCFSLR